MARVLSVGFLLVGLAFLGLAAFVYVSTADAAGVTIDQPDRDLPGVGAGVTTYISFPVRNPTRHPARVVGLAEC